LRCLGNADAEVRQRGASALGELGSTAALASAPLAALLQDPDPNVRTVAARSLGRLGNSAREALGALRAARDGARGERRSILDHAIAQIERGRPGSE
jgi:HEAT repeat protein